MRGRANPELAGFGCRLAVGAALAVPLVVLAVATLRDVRQNLLVAFAYDAVGVPIAAGPLYPAFGILLSPMVGRR